MTKFVGDWQLARGHLMARERFHLDQWRTSVEQRLSQLDALYTLAHNELYEWRMLVLKWPSSCCSCSTVARAAEEMAGR